MENTKNQILVPIDFSEVAEAAIEHAAQVAKSFDNEINLLHIIEDHFFGNLFGSKSGRDELILEAINSRLDKVAKELSDKHNVVVKTHVKEGRIYRTIVETADELNCDSIIMGTNGAHGIEHIIGSNASRVIRHANVPVVIVKEKDFNVEGYKNIVMPIDLTVESKQKVTWAIRLGKKYDSTIHIVAQQYKDEWNSNQEEAALNFVSRQLNEAGVKNIVKYFNSDDYPGNNIEDILQYAEEENTDLILILTQQNDKDIQEYIIGSNAQRIVNNIGKVPVMTVNPLPTGVVSELWTGR